MRVSVLQSRVLRPVLYLLYTSYIPITDDTLLATFADDTAVISKGIGFEDAADKAEALNGITA